MPLIRPGMRKPPPGFDVLQAKLEAFEEEMKLATQEESKGVVGQTTRPRRTDSSSHKRPREGPNESVDPVTSLASGDADTVAEATLASSPREVTSSPSSLAGEPQADNAGEAEANTPSQPVPPLWRMAAINHARTRYVFNAYAKHRTISKEVYDYCVEAQLIDGGLARRWRLPGYERLCCTACGVPGAASLAANLTSKYALRDRQERRLPTSAMRAVGEDTATCICRVPASQRKNKHFVACAVCGCTGCCSADAPPQKTTGAKPKKDASS